jgi:hypothetical protein
MIQQFAEAVQREIRKDMNTKTDYMASGFCKSFEEYKHLCGEIRGLATAEEHLLDLAKKDEQADEQ